MKESSLVKRYAKALVLAMDDEAEFRPRTRRSGGLPRRCSPATKG